MKTLSILSYEFKPQICQECGDRGLVFCCHKLTASRGERAIVELCKPCAEVLAGTPENVHVKSTYPFLRKVWDGTKKTGERLERQARKAIGSGRF